MITAETLLPVAVGLVAAGLIVQYFKAPKSSHRKRQDMTKVVQDSWRNKVVGSHKTMVDHNRSNYNNTHSSVIVDAKGQRLPQDDVGHPNGPGFHRGGLSKTGGEATTVAMVNRMQDDTVKRKKRRT